MEYQNNPFETQNNSCEEDHTGWQETLFIKLPVMMISLDFLNFIQLLWLSISNWPCHILGAIELDHCCFLILGDIELDYCCFLMVNFHPTSYKFV